MVEEANRIAAHFKTKTSWSDFCGIEGHSAFKTDAPWTKRYLERGAQADVRKFLHVQFSSNPLAIELADARVKIANLETQVQWLSAALLGRGIEKNVGVCGGAARILRTRIPVWTLESFRRKGASEAQLLEAYPSLTAADLVAAWAYVSNHKEEIEESIEENRITSDG